jgi:hypothetical protein
MCSGSKQVKCHSYLNIAEKKRKKEKVQRKRGMQKSEKEKRKRRKVIRYIHRYY